MGNKTIWAYCAYQVVLVPRRAACEFYTGMFRPLQRCVEIAAGKFAGVQVGRVDTEPDYLYITLFIPPKYTVGKIVSEIKTRTHAMIRKSAISKGFLSETDDFKAWVSGYYVSTAQRRNRQEVATYVKEVLAKDTPDVGVWRSDDERKEARM